MITVKPLEWELVDDDHYAARGLGIGYEVRKSKIRETVRVRFASGVFGEWQDFDGDIEAAKDAAFADYSGRIMSAIEPAGVGVETPPPSTHVAGDRHPDDLAVDRFAAAMKAKLAKKRADGRGGWDDPEQCSIAFLADLLRKHIAKGDPVDVGNLAMMIHQRGGVIE